MSINKFKTVWDWYIGEYLTIENKSFYIKKDTCISGIFLFLLALMNLLFSVLVIFDKMYCLGIVYIFVTTLCLFATYNNLFTSKFVQHNGLKEQLLDYLVEGCGFEWDSAKLRQLSRKLILNQKSLDEFVAELIKYLQIY